MDQKRGDFTISTDKSRLDLDVNLRLFERFLLGGGTISRDDPAVDRKLDSFGV